MQTAIFSTIRQWVLQRSLEALIVQYVVLVLLFTIYANDVYARNSFWIFRLIRQKHSFPVVTEEGQVPHSSHDLKI